MTKEEIGTSVTQFIRTNFLFSENQPLDENSSLIGNGTIDSTGVLELICFLESTFNITFRDDELIADNFDSVALIKSLILRKLNGSVK